MAILIRIYNPLKNSPTDPAELVVCDENDNVIYFSSIDEADRYREKHSISSVIIEL